MFTVNRLGVVSVFGCSLLVMSTGLEASPPTAQVVEAVVEHAPQADLSDPVPVIQAPAESVAADTEELVTPESLQTLVSVKAAHPQPVDANVECMAKVIYHEAANQALTGQLAVAQVIQNRTHGGPTFPTTVCGVVNQTGQFFKTRHFKAPKSDLARWRVAVAVAAVAQERRLAQVAPGALFYHAAYARPTWSHRHLKIARIGDQVFYR